MIWSTCAAAVKAKRPSARNADKNAVAIRSFPNPKSDFLLKLWRRDRNIPASMTEALPFVDFARERIGPFHAVTAGGKIKDESRALVLADAEKIKRVLPAGFRQCVHAAFLRHAAFHERGVGPHL